METLHFPPACRYLERNAEEFSPQQLGRLKVCVTYCRTVAPCLHPFWALMVGQQGCMHCQNASSWKLWQARQAVNAELCACARLMLNGIACTCARQVDTEIVEGGGIMESADHMKL